MGPFLSTLDQNRSSTVAFATSAPPVRCRPRPRRFTPRGATLFIIAGQCDGKQPGLSVLLGWVVLWGTRHLVVEVAPTVVVGCIVVVADSDDGTPAAVVGGGIATMLPAGPAGPAGPCAPGGPGAGGALGPVELGSVDDGGRLVVGGWMVTGGSVVGPGASRLAGDDRRRRERSCQQGGPHPPQPCCLPRMPGPHHPDPSADAHADRHRPSMMKPCVPQRVQTTEGIRVSGTWEMTCQPGMTLPSAWVRHASGLSANGRLHPHRELSGAWCMSTTPTGHSDRLVR